MEEEFTSGLMEKFTMENGIMGRSMEVVYGKV